jgi:drug/metabolite transporter (DMT)-like permease
VPRRTGRLRDWTLLLFCNLTWASQFTLVKLVQERLGPAFTTLVPMAIATLLLVPFVRREQRLAGGARAVPGRDVWRFVLLGVLGQVAAQLCVTWGTGLSLAANAALLQLALPAVTALMAFALLGERMSGLRWAGFALAIAGAVQCSGIDWGSLQLADRRFLLGNLLVLGGVAGSAFYNVYGKRLLLLYTPLEVLLYSYYAVVAVLLPFSLRVEPDGPARLASAGAQAWLGLLLLALFQYLLSMVVFLTVLTRLDATQAALSNYLIPFFGVVLAGLALGERLSGPMLAGGALVLASTLLVTVYEERGTPAGDQAAEPGARS